MKNGAIPILTYHSLDEGSSALSLSPELFSRQMQFLKDGGFTVMDLVELAKILGDGAALPERAVVLTFDDGFESFYTSAFPVLCRLGFPATVFVVVDYVGRKNDWPGQPRWVEVRPLMNWQQLSEISSHGIAIGSHTLTHPVLSELDSESLWREIYLSKARLEERLGGRVQAFSYPYGIYSPALKTAISRAYLCGCAAQLGDALQPDHSHGEPPCLPDCPRERLRSSASPVLPVLVRRRTSSGTHRASAQESGAIVGLCSTIRQAAGKASCGSAPLSAAAGSRQVAHRAASSGSR